MCFPCQDMPGISMRSNIEINCNCNCPSNGCCFPFFRRGSEQCEHERTEEKVQKVASQHITTREKINEEETVLKKKKKVKKETRKSFSI